MGIVVFSKDVIFSTGSLAEALVDGKALFLSLILSSFYISFEINKRRWEEKMGFLLVFLASVTLNVTVDEKACLDATLVV